MSDASADSADYNEWTDAAALNASSELVVVDVIVEVAFCRSALTSTRPRYPVTATSLRHLDFLTTRPSHSQPSRVDDVACVTGADEGRRLLMTEQQQQQQQSVSSQCITTVNVMKNRLTKYELERDENLPLHDVICMYLL